VRLLEKLGYRVEVADNGREAVDACERTSYDAVLMDGQMPGMDGFEATRRIRARESDGARTPIIAMTASAMKGDRERCIEAGMDDYVSKPVSPEAFEEVLTRWIRPHGPQPRASSSSAPSEKTNGPLDEEIIDGLLKIDEDGTLMDELVETFLRLAPARLAALEKAAEDGTAAPLERAAHSFLGSCGNLGCRRMADLCAKLEVLGRAGSTKGARELVRALVAEMEVVRPHIEALPGRHPTRTGSDGPAPSS
jgi:CheY-like chemotaxis protein